MKNIIASAVKKRSGEKNLFVSEVIAIMSRDYGKAHYLGAWSYFFLGILYSIPVIGWVFLVIHALGGGEEHENRRHYARSFFVGLLLTLILLLIGVVILLLVGGSTKLVAFVDDLPGVIDQIRQALRSIVR